MSDGAVVYFAAVSPWFVAWGAAEIMEWRSRRRRRR